VTKKEGGGKKMRTKGGGGRGPDRGGILAGKGGLRSGVEESLHKSFQQGGGIFD